MTFTEVASRIAFIPRPTWINRWLMQQELAIRFTRIDFSTFLDLFESDSATSTRRTRLFHVAKGSRWSWRRTMAPRGDSPRGGA